MAGGSGSGSGGATGEGEAAGYGMGSSIGTAPAGLGTAGFGTTTGLGDSSTSSGQNSVALGGQVGPATGLSGFSVAGVNAPGPATSSYGYGNPGASPSLGGVSTASTVGPSGAGTTAGPGPGSTGGGSSGGQGGAAASGLAGQVAQSTALANAALELGVAPSALNVLWSAMNGSQVSPLFNTGMLGIAGGMGTNALAGINRGATSPFGQPAAQQSPQQQTPQLLAILQALNMNPMQMIGVPGMSMGFPAGNPSLGSGGIQGTPGIAGTLGPSHNFGSATGMGAPSMAAAPNGASPTGGPGAGISGNTAGPAPSMAQASTGLAGQVANAQTLANQALAQQAQLRGMTGMQANASPSMAAPAPAQQTISPSVLAGLASLAGGGYSVPQVTGSGRYS